VRTGNPVVVTVAFEIEVADRCRGESGFNGPGSRTGDPSHELDGDDVDGAQPAMTVSGDPLDLFGLSSSIAPCVSSLGVSANSWDLRDLVLGLGFSDNGAFDLRGHSLGRCAGGAGGGSRRRVVGARPPRPRPGRTLRSRPQACRCPPRRRRAACRARPSRASCAGRLRPDAPIPVSTSSGHSTDTPMGAPLAARSRWSVSERESTACLLE